MALKKQAKIRKKTQHYMARIKYYYNTETCEFERSTVNGKSIIRTLFTYFFSGSLVGGVLLTCFFYLDVSPDERRLKGENRELLDQVKGMGEQLTALETDVEALHKMDADVYRTILNAEPISASIWDAGSGGSAGTAQGEDDDIAQAKEKLKKMQSKVDIHQKSLSSVLDKYENKKDEMRHIPSIRPVMGDVISGFGQRMHPILNVKRPHTGLDFQAPMGSAVYATADGRVKFCGVKQNGYGMHIDVDHGYGYESKYAHLSRISVRPGQLIKRGDLIGYSGNSGLSKGPHLHYEITKNGEKINPIDYFYSDLDPETYLAYKKKASQENESMD
jgi:murein DD-endopeptidase MepM/ murein hydrolase activator NlpD